MTKKELVRQIALELEVDQILVRLIVQRTLDSLLQAVVSDGRIKLRNFGVFERKRRAARKARNPQTNEGVLVPAKNVLTFQPGKKIAAIVADSDETAPSKRR